ncbi:Arm DNA-binding domain-containing protein [Pediococcus acidilactici]|nr:Arm DNA-binding domain-containing protein [Pediococcus acidilactici]
MAKIKKYTTKTGKIRYEFQVYVGVDSLTGRQKTTRRRGFKTRKEASIVLSRLELEIEKRGLQEDERRFFRDVCAEWMEQYRLTVR